MALNTLTSEHRDLRKITIWVPGCLRPIDQMVREVEAARPGMRWRDLDSLLVQLWESRSIPSKISGDGLKEGKEEAYDWATYLLPETMNRGTVDKSMGLSQ
jgi:hypothetical protein